MAKQEIYEPIESGASPTLRHKVAEYLEQIYIFKPHLQGGSCGGSCGRDGDGGTRPDTGSGGGSCGRGLGADYSSRAL